MNKNQSKRQKAPYKSLLERLTDIRKTNSSATDKQRQITTAVRDELSRSGKFIRTPEKRAFFFHKEANKLYEILPNDEAFGLLLYELAELNGAGKDAKYILSDLRQYALVYGDETSVSKFCCWQNEKLYLSRFDGKMYVMDGEAIHTQKNGEDGVLFLDRPKWAPWEAGSRSGDFSFDDFVKQMTFDIACDGCNALTLDDYRKLFTTYILSLFFPELLPTKPLALFLGEKGSGKTSAIRRIGKLLFGNDFDVKPLERAREDAFTVLVSSHYLVPLDNVDAKIPWLCDRLATIATGGSMSLRKLYTTATELEILPRCFVLLTSRTPQFNREDVADRLLIFPVKSVDKGQRIPELKLIRQINENRESLLGELVEMLNRVVAYITKNDIHKQPVDFRMADFAALGRAIRVALDGLDGAKQWDAILCKMQAKQQDFSLEGDTLVPLILEWMGDDKQKKRIAPTALFKELKNMAEAARIQFDYRNSGSMGKHLSNSSIKTALEEQYGIRIEETKKNNSTYRTFKRIVEHEKSYN